MNRKQIKIEFSHPGEQGPSKERARDLVAKKYNISDKHTVIMMDLKTTYGGGRTRANALVYDNMTNLKKNDTRFRMLRMGLEVDTPDRKTRRARKDIKTKCRKLRGKSLSTYKASLKK